MKRKFLLPAFAVIFAVSGAYASNKFSPVYYLDDSECITEPVDEPCTIGSLFECNNGSEHYYYKTDQTSTECQQLYKNTPQ